MPLAYVFTCVVRPLQNTLLTTHSSRDKQCQVVFVFSRHLWIWWVETGVGTFWGPLLDDHKVFVKAFLGHGSADVIVWTDSELEVPFVVAGDLDGSFHFCGFRGKLLHDYSFSVFSTSLVFARSTVSISTYSAFPASFNVFLQYEAIII